MIQFTEYGSNRAVWVNPNHVIAVHVGNNNRTWIRTLKGDFSVKGEVRDVVAKLKG